jgi:hypothetical protein
MALTVASLSLALSGVVTFGQEKDRALGDEDKAEIVKLALELAVVKKEIPDYKYIKDLENIPISTENIDAGQLPKFDGVKLVLLKPEEIQERAEEDGNYVYFLEFEEFRIEGAKVIVTLNHYPKYAKKPHPKYADKPRVMAFGGALISEYQKRDGKWLGEVVGRAIA